MGISCSIFPVTAKTLWMRRSRPGSEALFMDSRLYQHAVAMCILEIGELAKHLSEGFLQEHAEIPWRAICRMRDMYAHHYHRTDPQQLWATVTMDLPVLKAFCDQLHRE